MIEFVVYAIGILLAFFMALVLGMNDAANPTDCAVGSGTLSMKKALILFAIFAALGGIILGPFVMKTVDRGLIDRDATNVTGDPILSDEKVIVGSFTAVLSAGLWVVFSTWRGMPVSTTHAVIGGILGFGLIACSSLINWSILNLVLIALIIAPIASLLLATGLFRFFRAYFRKTRKERSNLTMIYLLISFISFAVFTSVFYKILNWGVIETLISGFLAALVVSTLAIAAFRKIYGKFEVTKALSYLLIVSLCFSAFAFGANDMANTTGVFVTPTERLTGGMPTMNVMFLLALLGAGGIALGGLIWGYRVIATSAYRVTRLDPVSGAAAEYSNAITVFLFTVVPIFFIGFGIPVSTTHSSIGAIIGVGLAMRGLGGISKRTTGKILSFWILTIPCVALISMSLFWLFSQVMVIP